MTTLLQTRQPKGEPAGGQFAAATHTEPSIRLATEASQAGLYETASASSGSDAGRAEAARAAIRTGEFTFEELARDGEQEHVENLATDDTKIIQAINNMGGLEPEQQLYFGKFLAEQLHEDDLQAEEAHWAGRHASERALEVVPAPEDAYEPNDPKHPGYADRLGL